MIEQKVALERLRPSEKADHKTVFEEQGLKREVCTDGTRVKMLEDITKWANDRSSWLRQNHHSIYHSQTIRGGR